MRPVKGGIKGVNGGIREVKEGIGCQGRYERGHRRN